MEDRRVWVAEHHGVPGIARMREGTESGSSFSSAGSWSKTSWPLSASAPPMAAMGIIRPAARTPHRALMPRKATILPRVVAVSKKGEVLLAMRAILRAQPGRPGRAAA